MKKIYTAPELEVKVISSQDVITASGGLVADKFTKLSKGPSTDNSVSF